MSSPPPPSNASPPPPPATAASRSPPPPTPTPPARPTPPASSPPLSSSPSPPQSNPPPSTSPPPSFTTPILSPPSGSTPRPSGRNSPPIASGRNPPPEVTGTARSPPSTSSSSSNDNSNGLSTGSIVGIVIGGVFFLVLLVILSILFIRCKSKKGAHSDPPLLPPRPKALCYSQRVYNWLRGVLSSGHHVSNVPPEPSRPPTGTALGFSLRKFTYEELSSATDGFSESNHLGHGGFGYVHRGVLLQDGIEIEVAVKQLKAGSGQGDREFQAEVEIISRLHHKNLVSLVGYCNAQTQRLIVYDFVPNKTLEFHLHGKGSTRTLDWSKRLKISQGTARGLAYLHENCTQKIIHRDIKAANILLNEDFEAKVADFGLARIISAVDTYASRVMGTPGYMAPEYISTGILTVKSDVFSFGVVLLELITGRRPQSFMGNGFVEWARPLLTQALKDKNFDALVDPRLQKDYDPNEMARMAACAAACVHPSEWHRPGMSQVVMALEGNIASLSDLNEGMRPGPSSVYSSDNDTVQYNENMKNMLKMAFSSQEYGSTSQYSNTTSEYGLYPSGSSSDVQQTREIEMKDFCGGKLDGEQLK